MNTILKKITACILVFIVLIHFILLFFYASPLNSFSKKVNELSFIYVNPIFHQNWNLFVPAPKIKHSLYIRHKTYEKWSNWKDVIQTYVEKNQRNRIVGNDMILLLFSNSLHYFNYTMPQNSQLFVTEPTDMSFKVLNYELSKYMLNCENVNPNTNYELLVISEDKISKKAWYFKALKTAK